METAPFLDKYKDFDSSKINIQFEETHDAIIQAYQDLYNELGKRPTYKQIAERIGKHPVTVHRHMKEMQFETDIAPKHKLNLDKALDTLYTVGIRDENVKALVEYIKLIGNPTQKQEIDQTTTNKVLKVNFNPKKKVEEALEKINEIKNDDSE